MVLISIFLDLTIKKKVTAGYLSEKYELSTRTIYRYIDTLASGGVPIISLKGKDGGFMLDETYTMDRMLFNDGEYDRIREVLEATRGNYDDGLNERILRKLTTDN